MHNCTRCRMDDNTLPYMVSAFEGDRHAVRAWLCGVCATAVKAGRALLHAALA